MCNRSCPIVDGDQADLLAPPVTVSWSSTKASWADRARARRAGSSDKVPVTIAVERTPRGRILYQSTAKSFSHVVGVDEQILEFEHVAYQPAGREADDCSQPPGRSRGVVQRSVVVTSAMASLVTTTRPFPGLGSVDLVGKRTVLGRGRPRSGRWSQHERRGCGRSTVLRQCRRYREREDLEGVSCSVKLGDRRQGDGGTADRGEEQLAPAVCLDDGRPPQRLERVMLRHQRTQQLRVGRGWPSCSLAYMAASATREGGVQVRHSRLPLSGRCPNCVRERGVYASRNCEVRPGATRR